MNSITNISVSFFKLVFVTLLIYVFSFQVSAQPLDIIGNYTIDPSGGAFNPGVNNNFLSFSEAVDTLINRGISGAVTIASVADSTNTIFRLVRNVSGDDNTGDLRLVGIKIFYTTDAANDA